MTRSSPADRRIWLLIGALTLLAALFIPFSHFALGVEYTYTLRVVALGGALLGVVAGGLGCFAVLRRESLIGDALSHAALPGVGIAFLIAGRELGALLIGAGVASWLGVYFIQALTHTTRLKQDAAMGIVLASWFAAGIALLAYIQSLPTAGQAGLNTFIFGQAAAIVERDVQMIALVGLAAFLLVAALWKEFKLVTFDAEFAHASGLRVGFLNLLLSTLIVVAIVLGLQLAGVILMVGLLIAPGIAARQWTHKLEQMIILAAVFGAFAGGAGAILSAVEANLPTGPMIIVVAFALVMLSIAFAPGRGLVWMLLRRRADRRRFAQQQLLRDLYKYARDHGGPQHPVPEAFLAGVRGSAAHSGLAQLERRGWARSEGDRWKLTPAGAQAAADDAHSQRLWDIYRQFSDALALPALPEDRQHDIHDSLPPEAIERLERKLKELDG